MVARARAQLTRLGIKLPFAGWLTRTQAKVYRATKGRVWKRWLGSPIVVLETVGRKTGQTRATPLIHARAGNAFVVAAANSGSDRTPQWYRNLLAEPRAALVHAGRRLDVRAREADDHEYRELWQRVVDAYPPAAFYPSFTDRRIPVLVLEPTT